MNFIVVLLGSWFLLLSLASASWSADVDKNQAGKAVPLPVELKVVEKWRGTWDVKAMRRQPQPAGEVIYTETFDWVLDGRYLRSERRACLRAGFMRGSCSRSNVNVIET